MAAHGIAGYARFPGDLPQGQALQLGVVHRLPESLLPRSRHRLLRWLRRHGTCMVGLVIIVIEGFRGSQPAQLGLGGALFHLTVYGPADFGGGSRGPTGGGAQCSRTLRRLLGRNGLTLMLKPEAAVGKFRDFHLHPGIAGPVLAGQQLPGAPVVLDGVVSGYLSGVLEAERLRKGQTRIQGTVGPIRLFRLDREIGVEARDKSLQYLAGLLDSAGPGRA